jgi:exopolysaccharide production protein ExoZ
MLKTIQVGVRDLKAPKYRGSQILRMLASCFVLAAHSTVYTSERLGTSEAKHVWLRGGIGVDLFFVISGFVMIISSRSLTNRQDGWKIFAQRRIVRIVPVYWILTTVKVTVTIVAAGLVLHTRFSVPKTLFSYFFLPTYNLDGGIQPVLGVGWTLNLEMLFYLLFTIALFLRTNVYHFLGAFLSLLALGAYFRQPSWPPIAFYLDSIVIEFYFGMLVARVNLIRRPVPPVFGLALLFGGVAALLLIPAADLLTPRGLTSGVPAAMTVWGMASLEQYLDLTPKMILYLGDASYMIYLIHPFIAPAPAVAMAMLHLFYPATAVALAILSSLLGGSILHSLLERPLTLWFRDHLRNRGQSIIQAT